MAAAKFSQTEGSIGSKIHSKPSQPQPQQQNQASESVALNQEYPLAIRGFGPRAGNVSHHRL